MTVASAAVSVIGRGYASRTGRYGEGRAVARPASFSACVSAGAVVQPDVGPARRLAQRPPLGRVLVAVVGHLVAADVDRRGTPGGQRARPAAGRRCRGTASARTL